MGKHLQIISNAIIIVLLCGVLFFLYKQQHTMNELSQSESHYVAIDSVGRLTKIIPLDAKYVEEKELIQWTGRALEETLNVNPENYRERLHLASRFFDASGWQDFTTFMSNNLIYEQFKMKNCSLKADVKDIDVLGEGVKGESYMWKIRAHIAYKEPYCPNLPETQNLHLTIVRGRSSIHPLGIAISDWKEE